MLSPSCPDSALPPSSPAVVDGACAQDDSQPKEPPTRRKAEKNDGAYGAVEKWETKEKKGLKEKSGKESAFKQESCQPVKDLTPQADAVRKGSS